MPNQRPPDTVLDAIPDVIGVTEARNNEEERKRIEQQLLQAQKLEAIGTLSGGIAHDFNNLLMGIQGRASLMELDLESNHPCREHVEVIMECSRNATELTSQLLGVARGGRYETKPISINDVVMSSSTMFGRTKKEIRIHTKLHDPPPVVVADRRHIEQVFLNIYINAWQAMHKGGELYLETTVVTLATSFYSKKFLAQITIIAYFQSRVWIKPQYCPERSSNRARNKKKIP